MRAKDWVCPACHRVNDIHYDACYACGLEIQADDEAVKAVQIRIATRGA